MASRKRDRTDTTDTYRPAPLVRTFSFADAVVRITSQFGEPPVLRHFEQSGRPHAVRIGQLLKMGK